MPLAPDTLVMPSGRPGLHPEIEAVLDQARSPCFAPRAACVFVAFDHDLPHLATMCGRPSGYAHSVGVVDLGTRGDLRILAALQKAHAARDLLFQPTGWPQWSDAADLAGLYWAGEPNPFGQPPLWEVMCRRAVIRSVIATFRHQRLVDEPAPVPAC